MAREPVSRWMGIPVKHVSILLLMFQNAALILIMHYSRIMPLVDGKRYLPSTAVLTAEVIKLCVSLTMALYELAHKQPNLPATTLFSTLASSIASWDSWRLTIPAVLFTFQTNLHYLALSHLDAATFQVTDQLKILTTAIFSVLILGRVLGIRQWVSLVLLAIGIAVIQIPQGSVLGDIKALRNHARGAISVMPRSLQAWKRLGEGAGRGLTKRSATYQGIEEDFLLQNPKLNTGVGFISVLVACISSGLGSVIFERILKDQRHGASGTRGGSIAANVWTRNVQLAFYSLFPAFFLGVVLKDGQEVARSGFFGGYNWVVWVTIILQSSGGLLVSFVISYADNIAKNFATSISILLSFLGSWAFFDLSITFYYLLGTCVVLSAVFLYNSEDSLRQVGNRLPPIVIVGDDEKAHDYNDEQGYFDIESVGAPFRGKDQGLSTSRPGTPSVERHHFRAPSGKRYPGKRSL